MERSHAVAFQARRFRLLADNPRFLSWDREVRARAVANDPELDPLDALLVGGAGEADRLCASAVRMLRDVDDAGRKTILALLTPLPAEHLLGVYYAIPREHQFPLRRGLYEMGRQDCLPMNTNGVEEAIRTLDLLISEPLDLGGLEDDEAEDFASFTSELLSRQLGLPSELSGEEERFAEAGEQIAAAMLRSG